MNDYLIVGAGVTGSVLAERLATVPNNKVLPIHDPIEDYNYQSAEILLHQHARHIFHNDSKRLAVT